MRRVRSILFMVYFHECIVRWAIESEFQSSIFKFFHQRISYVGRQLGNFGQEPLADGCRMLLSLLSVFHGSSSLKQIYIQSLKYNEFFILNCVDLINLLLFYFLFAKFIIFDFDQVNKMVMESIIEILLSKYLDKFFYGIVKQNLHVKPLDGIITIRNIGLHPNLFMNLNLPIDLYYSYVEKIQINIPWRSDEVTLTVNVSNIYAILLPKGDLDLPNVFIKQKQSIIKQIINEFMNKNVKKNEEQEKKGTIASFIRKLLDNVKVNINSIHFRYESIEKGYSFGVKVNQITCLTVDEEEKPYFFNRQKCNQNFVQYSLKIQPLAIYFNSNENNFLSTKDYPQITNEMGRMDLQDNLTSQNMWENNDPWGVYSMNYIFAVSIKSQLKKYISKESFETPEIECSIKFSYIESKISHEQYQDIIDTVNEFVWYQGQWQHYIAQTEISPFRQREAGDIMKLIKKKNSTMDEKKKQKQVVKKIVRKHLAWVFQSVYEEILKQKFLEESIKKKVTLENLFQNEKIVKIIKKIEIEKLKKWVVLSLEARKKYEDESNFFTQTKNSLKTFTKKQFQKLKGFKKSEEDRSEVVQLKDKQAVLKINVFIEKVAFEIQKQNTFGIALEMNETKIELLQRKKNFRIDVGVEDLKVSVFQTKVGQKTKTYIPILKKNLLLEEDKFDKNLLELRFEKSPLGKPFVFSETHLNYQSMDIIIYPEIIEKLYELLWEDSELVLKKGLKNREKKKENLKKKTVETQKHDEATIRSVGFQHNIIEGKVRSPWIIIPLSKTNDKTKECWTLRLGDLTIKTIPPETWSMGRDDLETLYYEHFNFELSGFQLKYFSSMNYFYNWLRFNMKTQELLKLSMYKNERIVDIIHPINCFVDLSALKKYLSPVIKNNREAFKAKIQITKVLISVPRQMILKVKQRMDLFSSEKQTEFVETNVQNIMNENTISGYAKITNEKFRCMSFLIVLKGSHIYYFPKINEKKYLFFTDVRDFRIKLTSFDKFCLLNENKKNFININLEEHDKFFLWKKFLIQIINRTDRKIQTNPSNLEKQSLMKKSSKHSKIIEEFSISDFAEKQEIQRISGQSTKLSISFQMKRMSIQLLDENYEEFLFCNFSKAELSYRNNPQKLMSFSLSQWYIHETTYENQNEDENRKSDMYRSERLSINSTARKKTTNPFLSSKRFFGEDDMSTTESVTNFLEIKASYNDITGQLNEIQVNVDQLYISWKVELFVKVLSFFLISQDAGDAPPVSNPEKVTLKINFDIKKFYLYCYHQLSDLIALVKLHQISISYSQSNVEEVYLVNCKRFEMQKCMDNDIFSKLPVIMCNDTSRLTSHEVSLYDSRKVNYSQNQHFNPLFLSYAVRKLNTNKFENVKRLKKKFGDDLLVSEIICTWKNAIVYFQQEQFFRLLNYFLNKILGTVAAKFKKKQYSLNYIYQSLKMRKISIFNVQFTNCLFLITPHERQPHIFEVVVEKVVFSKNIRDDKEEYLPRQVTVPVRNHKVKVFYENMVFDIQKIRPYYRYGCEDPIPITSSPFNVQLCYSKLNFLKEYEPILNSLDDIDRTIFTKIRIYPGIHLELHKIVFLTFLQIFYQNIKHKDGKADIFQPPHPSPPLKKFYIQIESLKLNFYEYIESSPQNSRFKKRESYHQTNMFVFGSYQIDNFNIVFKQLGNDSSIDIQGYNIIGTGELPISPYKKQMKSLFQMQMESTETKMLLKIIPTNYKINVNLNKLNHILDFVNFDSQYVINKLMPKKQKESWQNINIFPKNCCVKIGQLEAEGDFYITYLKGLKNPLDEKILQYLEIQIDKHQNYQKKLKDVIDKEIKVSGSNINAFMRNNSIGKIQDLYFNRIDITNKVINKRYKKQTVHLGKTNLFMTLPDLEQLKKVYEGQIKKDINFVPKIYIQPWYTLPQKERTIEKRITQVEIKKSFLHVLSLLGEKNQIPYLDPYFTVEVNLPKIVYATQREHQLIFVNVNANVKQNSDKKTLYPLKICSVRDFRLHYIVDKAKNHKKIQVENAKNIKFHMKLLNERLCARLAKQITSLDKYRLLQPPSSFISFTNNIGKNVEINLKSFKEQNPEKSIKKQERNIINLGAGESKTLDYSSLEILSFLTSEMDIGFQLDKHGPIVLKKLSEINRNYPTQLFTSIFLFYQKSARGIQFHINEGNIIKNETYQNLFVWFFTKRKELCQKPFQLAPEEILFISNELSGFHWFISFTSHNSGNPSSVTELVPFKKEHSKMLVLLLENKSKFDKYYISIYNRYKIKNQLPIDIEINFKKIPAFSQGYIDLVDNNQNSKFIFILNGYGNFPVDVERIKEEQTLAVNQRDFLYKFGIIKRESKKNRKNQQILIFKSKYILKNNTKQAIQLFFNNRENLKIKIAPEGTICLPQNLTQITFINAHYDKLKISQVGIEKFGQNSEKVIGKRYQVKKLEISKDKEYMFIIEGILTVFNETDVEMQFYKNKKLLKAIEPQSTNLMEFVVPHQSQQNQHLQLIAYTKKGKSKTNLEIKSSTLYWMVGGKIIQVMIIINENRNFFRFLDAIDQGYTFKNELQGFCLTIKEKHGKKMNEYDDEFEKEEEMKPQNKFRVSIPQFRQSSINMDEENIQYILQLKKHQRVGLTNLAESTFTIEFYLQNKNIDFEQKYEFSMKDIPENCQTFHLKEGNISQDIRVLFFEKENKSWEIVIRSEKDHIKDIEKYQEKLQVNLSQIEVTIDIEENGADSLTLQISSLHFQRLKKSKYSLGQRMQIRLDKILMREGKNMPIIQMLKANKQVLKSEIELQKMSLSNCMKKGSISLSSLQFHIREGIVFKFLERIVDIRKQYFKIYNNQLIGLKDHKNFMKREDLLMDFLKKTTKQKKKLKIDQLTLESTKLYLSYSKDLYSANYQQFIHDSILKYFILIPGISQLKLTIPDIKINEFEGANKDLAKIILGNMKHHLGGTILSSLSSLSLLDSPIAAIDGITQYINALFLINNS